MATFPSTFARQEKAVQDAVAARSGSDPLSLAASQWAGRTISRFRAVVECKHHKLVEKQVKQCSCRPGFFGLVAGFAEPTGSSSNLLR